MCSAKQIFKLRFSTWRCKLKALVYLECRKKGKAAEEHVIPDHPEGFQSSHQADGEPLGLLSGWLGFWLSRSDIYSPK